MSAKPRVLDDVSAGWPRPAELSQVEPPPDELPAENLFWHQELPEDTFADWFVRGYGLPKDPLPEEIWWAMACEASAAMG